MRRAALAAVLAALGCGQGAAPRATPAPAPVAVSGPPAAALMVAIRSVSEVMDGPSWKSPDAHAWQSVPPTALLLNRTPPSFATDVVPASAPPAAEVRAVTTGARLYVRLRWDDPTEERWTGPTGSPFAAEPIYKRPTTQPAGFYDGAAVMVPSSGAWRTRFPALVMGDAATPVTMYLWRHGDTPQVLTARGRGTVTPAPGTTFTASVTREPGGWAGVFVLPPAEPDTPLAFAIWDGGQAQRNGDKFFTPWYRPTPAPAPSPKP